MIALEWKILQLDRNAADGGVTQAHWECTGEDEADGGVTQAHLEGTGEDEADGTKGRVYGSVSFAPDASAPDFKPFAELTQSDVLGWVWHSEGFDMGAVEALVEKQIRDQQTPPTIQGTPW